MAQCLEIFEMGTLLVVALGIISSQNNNAPAVWPGRGASVASVVQLAERPICNRDVAGPNPVAHPTYLKL